MILRKFTPGGRDAFVGFLREACQSGLRQVPAGMLESDALTEPLCNLEVEPRPFRSKLEFAMYVEADLAPRLPAEALRSDRMLWLWMTALHFEELCKDKKGKPKPPLKDIKHYACAGTGRQWPLDKHLLYFPWKLLRLHGDAAHWLLGASLGADTKVVREFANSVRRNVHTGFLEAAKILYFDAEKGEVKKGATNDRAPGNLRELDRVMGRLDMTYDIFEEPGERLLKMLPQKRFGRWMGAS